MRFLCDTSALLRIWRRQVDPAWYDVVDRGLIAVCEPVLAEALMGAAAKRYLATEEEFRQTYVWATVPDNIWDMWRPSGGSWRRTALTRVCRWPISSSPRPRSG